MITFETTVTEEFLSKLDSHRLDIYLYNALELAYPKTYSRSIINDHVKKGLCLLNHKQVKKSGITLKNGDHIIITLDTYSTVMRGDPNVNFEILYEDEEVIVINKPRGLVVHPAPGVKESTLVHGLYAKVDRHNFLDDLESVDRLGIVHRLDRETSGLMVVAKSMQAKRILQQQLQPPRKMKRTYHAITCGLIKHRRGLRVVDASAKSYELEVPLARDTKNRIKYCADFVSSQARYSETHFKILRTTGKFSLIECTLVTGRTHQIRAHLEYIGLPIIGDKVYKVALDKKLVEFYPVLGSLRGQMLHAKQLSFIHPRTELEMTFDAPYPEDFGMVLSLVLNS